MWSNHFLIFHCIFCLKILFLFLVMKKTFPSHYAWVIYELKYYDKISCVQHFLRAFIHLEQSYFVFSMHLLPKIDFIFLVMKKSFLGHNNWIFYQSKHHDCIYGVKIYLRVFLNVKKSYFDFSLHFLPENMIFCSWS